MTRWLLAMRLRWYSEATALLLRRRWQTILVLVGMIAPLGGNLLVVAADPVLGLLDRNHGMAWRFGAIIMWQGLWVLWTLMQYAPLRGGPFEKYERSLPIPARQRRGIDSAVLLLSNTPLLIPFVAAGIELGSQETTMLEIARGGLLLSFLLASQWCAQHEVLAERWRALPVFLAIDGWMAAALGLPTAWGVPLMTPAVVVSAWALLNVPPVRPRRLGHTLHVPISLAKSLSETAVAFLPPADRISIGILSGQNRATVLGKFFSCLLITFVACSLMSVWAYDQRCLPMVLIAFGILALSVSGLYRPLQMAHEAARAYTAALPLSPRWWVRADTTSILSFASPFVAVLVAPLWLHAGVAFRSAAAAVLSFALLTVLLQLPQRFSSRHAVITSTLLTAGWTFAAATYLVG